MTGKIFFIEAVDAAGKTTQVNMLKEKLGDNFVFYREPGGTPNAEIIRKTIFDTSKTASNITTAYLFAAARNDLYDRMEKDIKSGKNVICDRSILSTIVYQGADAFWKTNASAFEKIIKMKPKFILLDIDGETFIQRITLRDDTTDNFEQKILNDFNTYRRKYKLSLGFNEKVENNHTVIDGTMDVDAVNDLIIKYIKENL